MLALGPARCARAGPRQIVAWSAPGRAGGVHRAIRPRATRRHKSQPASGIGSGSRNRTPRQAPRGHHRQAGPHRLPRSAADIHDSPPAPWCTPAPCPPRWRYSPAHSGNCRPDQQLPAVTARATDPVVTTPRTSVSRLTLADIIVHSAERPAKLPTACGRRLWRKLGEKTPHRARRGDAGTALGPRSRPHP
jgi:hypothetical protein